MENMHYIGLDVHKKTIRYCVKDVSGRIHAAGTIPATRFDLDRWMKTLPQPWTAAMEATIFTGWIYDHLKPHAAALKVAHPLMLRAIAAAHAEKMILREGQARLIDLPEYTDAARLKKLVLALEEREELVGLLDRTLAAARASRTKRSRADSSPTNRSLITFRVTGYRRSTSNAL